MVNADRDASDIPTFEELKASGAPPVVPGEHFWMMFNSLPCCAHCGIVRRRDGKNKPCRGKVRIALREAPADPERTQSDTHPPANLEQSNLHPETPQASSGKEGG